MFGGPIKDTPGEIRQRAKTINFAILYGISAWGIAGRLAVPNEEAYAFIEKFSSAPGIRDYMERPWRSPRGTVTCSPCSGANVTSRTSRLEPLDPSLGRARRDQCALQGTTADLINRAMTRMDTALARAGSRRPNGPAGARRVRVRSAIRRITCQCQRPVLLRPAKEKILTRLE